MRALLIVAVVLGFASPASAVMHYVSKADTASDASNGHTWGTAWATIGKATATLIAGDSVTVGTGNYNEIVYIETPGTAAAPITYKAANTESVYVSWSDDLPDSAFVRADTLLYSNLYRYTCPPGMLETGRELVQTHFQDFTWDDDQNASRWIHTDDDGPQPMTPPSCLPYGLVQADTVPGSFYFIGDTLWVHTWDSDAPSNTTSDLWLNKKFYTFKVDAKHINVLGFRIWHGGNTPGAGSSNNDYAFWLSTNAESCSVESVYVAAGPSIIFGRWNSLKWFRQTHDAYRAAEFGTWRNTGGMGFSFAGHTTMEGGRFWHQNNGIGPGDSSVVDGVTIHGVDNHPLQPTSAGVTVRNMVLWNGQDGFYPTGSAKNWLVENSTISGGMTLGGPTLGDVTLRNCIVQDVFDANTRAFRTSGTAAATAENCAVLDHCIFVSGGSGDSLKCFYHKPDAKWYTLAEYIALCDTAAIHATITSCSQITTNQDTLIVGGLWAEGDNSWDVHLTSAASPAVDAGTDSTGATTDYEGDPRPIGLHVDIGADEYGELEESECWPPGLYKQP